MNTGSAFSPEGLDLWAYNGRNELTEQKRYNGTNADSPGSAVASRHFEFTYDPIGNRETYDVNTNTTTYTTNSLNQYTATTSPSESFTHDADGDLMQDGTYTYTWDAENRLIACQSTNPPTGGTWRSSTMPARRW